jgi:protein-tyrosine phosphatase
MRYLGRILGIIALRSRESYSLGMTNRPFSILFVCTGNICRSPTAEAVLRQQVREVGLEYRIRVDSAGTHGYHVGEPPDPRSTATSLARGVDMRDLRARKVSAEDFNEFDWLIAMDEGHHIILDRFAGKGAQGRVLRFLSFIGQENGSVPDPYYGGQSGFDDVYDMIQSGCEAILTRARNELGL